MNKSELIRKFNYVQADIAYAISMSKRTARGARLAWLRKYISLFKEYVELSREVRKVVGYTTYSKMNTVELLPKDVLFKQLNKLESEAWGSYK